MKREKTDDTLIASVIAGDHFSKGLEAAGLSPKDIVKLVNGYPQQVNNWKKRGVPAKFAAVVAKRLNTSPEQISSEYVSSMMGKPNEYLLNPASKNLSEREQPQETEFDFSDFDQSELLEAIILALPKMPSEDKKKLIGVILSSL